MTEPLTPAVIEELLPRIDKAIDRITSGHGPMRIPADLTDPDIVLGECATVTKYALELVGEVGRLNEANKMIARNHEMTQEQLHDKTFKLHEARSQLAECAELQAERATCKGDQWAADPTKWGHESTIKHLRQQLASAEERVAAFERKEYICQRCFLRQDPPSKEVEF